MLPFVPIAFNIELQLRKNFLGVYYIGTFKEKRNESVRAQVKRKTVLNGE